MGRAQACSCGVHNLFRVWVQRPAAWCAAARAQQLSRDVRRFIVYEQLVLSPACVLADAQDDSKRIVTFANRNDYISFRHHTYAQAKGVSSIELTEVRRAAHVSRGVIFNTRPMSQGGPFSDQTHSRMGPARAAESPGLTCASFPVAPQCGPRFELKLYQIKLGTMDQVRRAGAIGTLADGLLGRAPQAQLCGRAARDAPLPPLLCRAGARGGRMGAARIHALDQALQAVC